MKARALMLLGTASHVGKSILTTALCRILSDEGYRVAPFKAQNMSLNSAPTLDGREIGRAQALQAEACRLPPRAEMNPVLIKPSSDCGAQVVVMGRIWGEVSAWDYHRKRVEQLFPVVLEAYAALADEFDVVVLEGAGSPAEINLKRHDIVNLRMARAARARCFLVGDIERGGVFAALLGTLQLLDPDEREMFEAFLINRFRGDRELLQPGIDAIAPRLGLPCAGVVPFLPDLDLDEEDSVALSERRSERPRRGGWRDSDADPRRALRIAIPAVPHLANFTDFDVLAREPAVEVRYVGRPEEWRGADLVILPGSKQTVDDLLWLRARGFDAAIRAFPGGAGVLGICAGLQMLGERIDDPAGIENDGVPRSEPGLALLPLTTVLEPVKQTHAVRGRVQSPTWLNGQLAGMEFHGYEIHVGTSRPKAGVVPNVMLRRPDEMTDRPDGAVSADGRIAGTHVHGLFAADGIRHAFLAAARARCGLAAAAIANLSTDREASLNRLADHVRRSIDMDCVHRCLERPT